MCRGSTESRHSGPRIHSRLTGRARARESFAAPVYANSCAPAPASPRGGAGGPAGGGEEEEKGGGGREAAVHDRVERGDPRRHLPDPRRADVVRDVRVERLA